ncbi:hypothetical protein KP509_1Z079400 [Ceratopteris richardii]|nr:hypothetical protein KP509_1Z079400 [Ceratopteris richardii]KAH6558084.1 hypothetical protein KP509_1Z079400 [Ceratopteris richardii]
MKNKIDKDLISDATSKYRPEERIEWHIREPCARNPVVFFDICIGHLPVGRMKMELFKDVVPRTAENFRIDNNPLGYKGTIFHRIIRGFLIQGGDFVGEDGTGCISTFGSEFEDENFIAKHTGPGLLSMANSGIDSNGCQFFITCAKCDWLDDKNVVFGNLWGIAFEKSLCLQQITVFLNCEIYRSAHVCIFLLSILLP